MPVIQKTKYECFSRIVISSEVEKSSLQTDARRVFENRNKQHQVSFPYGNTPSFLFSGIALFRHPERRETSYVR